MVEPRGFFVRRVPVGGWVVDVRLFPGGIFNLHKSRTTVKPQMIKKKTPHRSEVFSAEIYRFPPRSAAITDATFWITG